MRAAAVEMMCALRRGVIGQVADPGDDRVPWDKEHDVARSRTKIRRAMAAGLRAATLGNLPVELSSFVGRAHELSEVKRLLATSHVITLTGPGGIGKTRLALRAAHRLGRHFPDGVWWVELAELEDPDLLAYALAQALGVQERLDDGIEEALLARLQERRLLLVLDNCEHLLDACRRLVSRVVSGCGRVRVVCTSRERLGAHGEAVVVLSALEVPADREDLSVARLGEIEALRLLADRAVAVAPDFMLTGENCAAASEICRRLDGMPLAIELAAVRLASMTAEDLRERLDDRLRLLAADPGTRPSRSQTLRATVDWSYELLSDEERILWRRLSVFAGSFGLEAAEEVCSGAGLERERIVDLIAGLVGKSILVMGHKHRRGRYRLLETLRLYGAQRLMHAGEDADFARRHAAWHAELISGGDLPWWGTGRQAGMFEVLDVEWANIEAALDFCAGSAPDAETGLRMAADLWMYWMVRGLYRAGSRRLAALLAIAPTPDRTRAMALWAWGMLSQATGEFAGALSTFEEACAVCDQTGGDRELAYALVGLGLAHLRLGNIELARDYVAQSHERMLRVEDPYGLAVCLYFFATAVATAGQLPDARRLSEDGLAACERAGDVMARGILNALLGTVEWQLGQAQAEARLKEALRINDRISHRWGMLMSLQGLAWAAGSSAQPERASLLLGAAAAMEQEDGVTLLAYVQATHDACETAARAALGDGGYRAAWERGHALSREQVVALALEDVGPVDVRPSTGTALRDDGDELSARELEVARLVASGMSNPAVAAELFVSVATVKTHVSHILGKLGLDSRVQLAQWIAAQGVGPAPPAAHTPAPHRS
jgi:predicted ATPase/DNA-binding CsgD family transcriptional regulator